MAGGTSGFNMKQSYKDNRSIQPGRNTMGENPYNEKGIAIEQRNPKNYSQIIAHRFNRKAYLKNISKIYYISLALISLILTIIYFYFN